MISGRAATFAVADPYTILGVARSATRDEIRAAYRKLVERYHPDRHHGNPLENLASDAMARINQAYEVLSDPAQRAAFDRRDGSTGAPARTAAPAPRLSSLAKWGLAILLLPLLLRSGPGILRALAGLLRVLFGEIGSFRGAPVALVLALAAAFFLGRALWKRYRQSRS
jgi:curved DNA-binding protein CbpA